MFLTGIFVLFTREIPPVPSVFRSSYALASSKTDYLQDYRAKIWKHGGGYIPLPIQQFLCSRLENSKDAEEIQAIAEFCAKQARGREYGPLDKLSIAARTRLISALFQNLPKQAFQDRVSALYLIEELRRGKMIGKGYLFVTNEKRFSAHLRAHPTFIKGQEVEDTAQETLLQW